MTEPRAMTGRVTLGNGEVRKLASPGKRLVARIIDAAIMVVVIIVLAAVGFAGVIAGSDGDVDSLDDAAMLVGFGGLFLFFVVAVLYETTLIATRGQTLGKMAMSIMVARADDGSVPGWGRSIGRFSLPGLLNLIPVAGGFLALLVYLSLLWDDRRQGWHDKMATTVVINA